MRKKETHNETEQQLKTPAKSFNAIPWVAGAVLLLGLAILAGIYRGRTVTVQSVRFEGNRFVALEDLEQQVDIPFGIKPDSLNYPDIIGSVEKLAYVKRAEVSVAPGGNLSIHVTERRPLAMLADGEQKIYVDADGVKLPLVLGKAVDVPVLYGFRAEPLGDTLKSVAFRAVRDFLVEVRRRPVSNATISEVVWTDNEGVVALTNASSIKLVLGKEDFKSRLRNWEAFYSKEIRQKNVNSLQSVDLRFRGQIVTRES